MKAWLLAGVALAAGWAQAPDAARIRTVTAEIAAISGLEVKRDVPFESISRDGWKQWVDDEVRRTVKPEEIRADELALRLFGLIPKDFDLRKATVDLLGEQAAALYDHRRKKMLFVQGATGGMEDAILVHELSHAVADQHFDMRRFLDKTAKTDESATARLAVVEGQAMWIMVESQLRQAGGVSLTKSRQALDLMLPAMGQLAADSYPVFARAPLYLRETLVFPYSAGIQFQQSAIEKLGRKGFTEVLRNPPNTTAEILHPERWPAPAVPPPALPPIQGLKPHRLLSAGTLGELDLQILLKQYCGENEARDLAPHWRAGAFDLYEHKLTQHPLLRWAVQFDTPESARAFLAAYARVLQGKWPETGFSTRTEALLEGTAATGAFRISADSATVRALESLKR
ncbi:MAG: hypothetical protein HY821_13135 [Acidobacteria bacterium]|nr:hypothetical protein [Acidobacteriota bacterium]